MKSFKLAVLQTKCVPNKLQNIKFIADALTEAGNNSANICILGQVCNSPYTKTYLHQFAENFSDSPTLRAIKQACLKHEMYAIGSIPRTDTYRYFNTAFVINPKGQLEAQMDKIHLFDIDIPGKIAYKQSDTFSPGNKLCVLQTEYCSIGLGICYDLRFPELALVMAQKGARMLVYPGSFNQTTGPLHWELLLRARAIDNQCFVVGVSTAQYKEDPTIYQAWGHSTVVDPFGKVLLSLDENPHISYCEINPNYTTEVREQIPITRQKRNDLYRLEQMKK